jgi:hypothetical protein
MSIKQNQKSTMQSLSKRLDISETELLIAIKQLGLNPSEVNESWGDAIANHLNGTAPQKLNGGTVPKSETAAPESLRGFYRLG